MSGRRRRLPRRAPSVVRRRGWIMLVCLIAFPTAVYAYSARLPDVYQATVIVEPRVAGSGTSGDAIEPLQLPLGLIVYRAGSDEVLRRTVAILGGELNRVGSLAAVPDVDTGWVTLTASHQSPGTAVTAANAFARALDEEIGTLTSDLRRVLIAETKSDLLLDPTPEERFAILAELRSLRSFGRRQGVRVVEPAAEAALVAPNPGRNAGLAAVVALLVAPLLMLLAEMIDLRVRRIAELEQLAGAEVLATIGTIEGVGAAESPAANESFRILRDRLTHSQDSSALAVIVVVSPFASEARSRVATGLAAAFALGGRRTVLVDAGLQGQGFAGKLGMPESPGFREVLAGLDAIAALRDFDRFKGCLSFLPAGAVDGDLERLLRSPRLAEVIERIGERSEVVVIDSSPVLVSSDALPLIRHASSVVAVFEMGRIPRQAVQRTREIVTGAGGRLLGAVSVGQPD